MTPTINSFNTADPKELSRQLSQLEQDVADGINAASAAAAKPFAPQAETTADNTAPIDTVTPIDSTGGNINVTVDAASQQNAGHRIAIVRLSASNTITVIPSAGTIQSTSALTDVLPNTLGLYEYVSIGTAWWRKG